MAIKQKVVVKVAMENTRKRCRVLKTAVGIPGVESVALDGEKILVVGEIDSAVLTMVLRKKMGNAELLSVAAAEEKKEKEKEKETKPEEEMPEVQPWAYPYPVWPPYQVQPVVVHDNCYYDPTCRIM